LAGEGSVTPVDDLEAVTWQIGRRPRAFRRVAVRCPWGRPAVTEQDPYDDQGAPFPTTYYLTCKHLVAAVSRLEAAGGVDRWSQLLADDQALREDHRRATEEQRTVRRTLAAGRVGADQGRSLDWGIGGSQNPGQLKCLHAHLAFALARPGYLLGEQINNALTDTGHQFPADRCCLRQVGHDDR
jgi:hypothetical protein